MWSAEDYPIISSVSSVTKCTQIISLQTDFELSCIFLLQKNWNSEEFSLCAYLSSVLWHMADVEDPL